MNRCGWKGDGEMARKAPVKLHQGRKQARFTSLFTYRQQLIEIRSHNCYNNYDQDQCCEQLLSMESRVPGLYVTEITPVHLLTGLSKD